MNFNYLNSIKYNDYIIGLLIVCFTIILIDRTNMTTNGILSLFFGISLFLLYVNYKFTIESDKSNNNELIVKEKEILEPLKNQSDILNFYNKYKYLEQYNSNNFNQSIKNAISFYKVYDRIMSNSQLKYYQFNILEKHMYLCIDYFTHIQYNIPNQKLILIELEKSINELRQILEIKFKEVIIFLQNNDNLNIYSKVNFYNKIKPYNSFKNI